MNIRTRILITLTLSMLFSSIAFAGKGWYAKAWNYRKTISNFAPAYNEVVSNYPMLIVLSNDTDIASHARSDGNDIIFVDSKNVTRLAHEVISYSAGTLIAWVAIPVMKGERTENVVYLYYGNSNVATSYSTNGAWDTNYMGVYHFTSPSGAATALGVDSSPYENDAEEVYLATATEGRIGEGARFTNRAYIDLPTSVMGGKPGTFEGWLKSSYNYQESINADGLLSEGIFYFGSPEENLNGFGNGANTEEEFHIHIGSDLPADGVESNKYGFFSRAVGGAWSGITNACNNGAWQHFALTWEVGGWVMYLNGGIVASGAMTKVPDAFSIDHRLGNVGSGNTRCYFGDMDEVRLSGVARGSNYVATSYSNQEAPGSFVTVADEETVVYADFAVETAATYALVASPVLFSNTSVVLGKTVTNYLWDFGDGLVLEYATDTPVSHVYTADGTYPVTLVVADTSGTTNVAKKYVTVAAYPVYGLENLSLSTVATGVAIATGIDAYDTITGYTLFRNGERVASLSSLTSPTFIDTNAYYDEAYEYSVVISYGNNEYVFSKSATITTTNVVAAETYVDEAGGAIETFDARVAFQSESFFGRSHVMMGKPTTPTYSSYGTPVSVFGEYTLTTEGVSRFSKSATLTYALHVEGDAAVLPRTTETVSLTALDTLTLFAWDGDKRWVPLPTVRRVEPEGEGRRVLLTSTVANPLSFGVAVFADAPAAYSEETVGGAPSVIVPDADCSDSCFRVYVMKEAGELVDFMICDMRGAVIHHEQGVDKTTFMWDGIDRSGATAESGIYLYFVRVGGRLVKKGRFAVVR